MHPIIMEQGGIGLCILSEKDIPRLLELENNTELKMAAGGMIGVATEDNLKKLILPKAGYYTFGILHIPSNKIIGWCNLKRKLRKGARLGISILDSDYINKGYGTIAMKLLVKFGFDVIGIENIFLEVIETNKRAIRVYKKTGFEYVGKLENIQEINGKLTNLLIYQLKREKWKGLNETYGYER